MLSLLQGGIQKPADHILHFDRDNLKGLPFKFPTTVIRLYIYVQYFLLYFIVMQESLFASWIKLAARIIVLDIRTKKINFDVVVKEATGILRVPNLLQSSLLFLIGYLLIFKS